MGTTLVEAGALSYRIISAWANIGNPRQRVPSIVIQFAAE